MFPHPTSQLRNFWGFPENLGSIQSCRLAIAHSYNRSHGLFAVSILALCSTKQA